MATKSFDLLADTLNGQILEFPLTVIMKCDKAFPVGEAVVRDYDEDNCIVAKKVFLIRYGDDVYGVTKFKSASDFYNYVQAACACCPCTECFPFINGCIIELNGCEVQMCGCKYHDALINNCQIQINGCDVRLN